MEKSIMHRKAEHPSLALTILAENIIGVLFERGAFTHHETIKVGLALKYYSFGLPAYILVKILRKRKKIWKYDLPEWHKNADRQLKFIFFIRLQLYCPVQVL